jgi:hypothetical protein
MSIHSITLYVHDIYSVFENSLIDLGWQSHLVYHFIVSSADQTLKIIIRYSMFEHHF